MVTGVDRLPNGHPTGFWLPEAAYPWRALRALGWDFAFASTRPGSPPISGIDRSDPPQRAFLDDPAVRAALAATVPVSELDPGDFGAVFIAGGHGAMFDLPQDEGLADFLSAFHAAGGVITAFCHGVAALLGVRAPGGAHLVADRDVTGFSNAEEYAVGLADVVPFLLADELERRGARYTAAEPFRPHVVADGTLVTGQNPASAQQAASTGLRTAAGEPLPAGWLRRLPA